MDTLQREGADAIAQAMAIIDKQLMALLQREIVSSSEMTDLLLDVRSLLSAGADA